MNLPDIAVRGHWRDLVAPGLRSALTRLEAQGVTFAWRHDGDLPAGTYVFAAERDGTLVASRDGSHTPRQAISDVILAAMSACGAFARLSPTFAGATSRKSSGLER